MTRRVAAAVTLTLLAAECSSSSTDGDTTAEAVDAAGDAATTDTTAPTVDSSQPNRTDSDVESGRSPGAATLIDAGAEPRAELRLATDARSRVITI